MNNSQIQDRLFNQVERLKNALAILDAAVEQFDSYEKYKPECKEAYGLLREIDCLGRLVRVADLLLTPASEELDVIIEECGMEKGGAE